MPDSNVYKEDNNKAPDLSVDSKRELVNLLNSRWRVATEHRESTGQIDRHNEAWDFYENSFPKAPVQAPVDRAPGGEPVQDVRMRLGDIPKAVEAVRALLVNSLFPADERFFKGTPANPVAAEYRELYEQYKTLSFQQDNTVDVFSQFILSMCLDDAACLSVPFKRKTRRKVFWDAPQLDIAGVKIPLPLLGLKKRVEKEWVEWEGTCAEVLDFMDWRVQPDARSLEEGWFMRRWYKPLHAVKEEYDYLPENITSYANTWLYDDELGEKKELAGLKYPFDPDIEPSAKEDCMLMVCYDDFVIDDKVHHNHLAVVLNGTDLIWFGENPYDHGRKPYIIDSIFTIPNQVTGMSLIRHAIPSAMVIDAATNKVLKLAAWAADPIFEVNMHEKVFQKRRNIFPGMSVPVRQVGNGIRQVAVSVNNIPILNEAIIRAQDTIEQVTGANPIFAGDEPMGPTNITAFQVQQHVQGGNSRFQVIMNHFSSAVLEPFLAMSFENDKQYKSKDEVIEGLGTLTPDLIRQMEFQWVITSSQAVNARAQELVNMKEFIFSLLPGLVQSGVVQLSQETITVDQAKLLQELLVKAGFKTFQDWLKVGGPQNANVPGISGDVGGGGFGLPGNAPTP